MSCVLVAGKTFDELCKLRVLGMKRVVLGNLNGLRPVEPMLWSFGISEAPKKLHSQFCRLSSSKLTCKLN